MSQFSNDDLASVLFIRFKKDASPLARLALDIHRTIVDPSRNYISNRGQNKAPYNHTEHNNASFHKLHTQE